MQPVEIMNNGTRITAEGVALELADGKAGRLRPQPDGSVLVVNSPQFDTRVWRRRRSGRRPRVAQ